MVDVKFVIECKMETWESARVGCLSDLANYNWVRSYTVDMKGLYVTLLHCHVLNHPTFRPPKNHANPMYVNRENPGFDVTN
jgi:hypothetical protein